ncbi:MAG: dipeptide ABC transporter ATP-binding protein [Galactobacter sp.]
MTATLQTLTVEARLHPGEAPVDTSLLQVSHLDVGFAKHGGITPVVHNVSLRVERGRCHALVGESGSGKSVTARTLVGLTGAGSSVRADRLTLAGKAGEQDLASLDPAEWRRVRGGRIGFVLQDALLSLDPLRPVGREIDEVLRLHTDRSADQRRRRVIELLSDVGVPEPELRAGQRPDQLSGGLRQRALIASALAGEPDLLVADEPTTALDATVQRQVLGLIHQAKERGVGVLLISHDLSVVGDLAETVSVMNHGRIVEEGPAEQILGDPQHAYTKSLLAAVPGPHTRGRRLSAVPDGAVPNSAAPAGVVPDGGEPATAVGHENDVVLQASGLRKAFRTPSGHHQAVDKVSFELRRGRTLGIVGESGSGKSTTARIALGLEDPDAGTVHLDGAAFSGVPERHRRRLRRKIAVVQQDPLSAFDPRWTTEKILLDAIRSRVPRAQRQQRVAKLLDLVRLPASVAARHPLTLSGGQRQRIAIARALASRPEVIVLDEAVSALDVSVQAQVLDLLVDLRDRLGLSYLFISHDLGVIAHLADDVLVMKDGRVVEHADVDTIFTDPGDPYTAELVSSTRPDRPAATDPASTRLAADKDLS